MITHDRPTYTALSFARLCETLPNDARISVWDNASSPETIRLLQTFESHPLVERIIYHQHNAKIRLPTNWFFQGIGEAQFVGIVADDCLMPDGWVETLERAHRDIPEAGILGAWPFPEEDFDENLARRKIQTINGHRVVRNCWVAGSGYLMKRRVIDEIGTLRERELTFPRFCIRAAAAGFVNGWYYPLLCQDHMDDPRSPHTAFKTDSDFNRLRPLSADTFGIETRDQWDRKLRDLARSLQVCSFDPSDYLGPKAWIKQKTHRLLGKSYEPRA